MARPTVDYEAAWEELEERILQRDGWGTRTLVTEMAHLRVKHKHNADASADADQAVHPSEREPGDAPPEDPKEDRNGSSNSSHLSRVA